MAMLGSSHGGISKLITPVGILSGRGHTIQERILRMTMKMDELTHRPITLVIKYTIDKADKASATSPMHSSILSTIDILSDSEKSVLILAQDL